MSFDRRALLVLAYVPVALTLLEYRFLPWRAKELFAWAKRARPGSREDLLTYAWWGGGCLVLLAVVPALLLWLGARTPPRELGLRVRGTGRDAWAYLLLFLVFAPVVWWVSQSRDFRATYPFFKPVPGGDPWLFVGFEAIYFLQFFAIEFFFRGVMVLGLRPALGRASILVMLAPYCMIHYHKPMPEAFGAIGAGLVLGVLSWRTRTVVYGWFLHYAVALSMDLLALSQRA